MLQGIYLVIGKKFSPSDIWKDIHDSEATFVVYVGEMARYLLDARPDPLDMDHKLRCMYEEGVEARCVGALQVEVQDTRDCRVHQPERGHVHFVELG